MVQSPKVLQAWFKTTDYIAGMKQLISKMSEEEYQAFLTMSETIIQEMQSLNAQK